MRDRGAHTGVTVRDTATQPKHTLAKLFTALAAVPLALVFLNTGIASADTPGSGQVPFSVAGPVGVGAVIIGIGGVVIGLLRRRRLATASPVAVAAVPGSAPQAVANALTTPMDRVIADERVA